MSSNREAPHFANILLYSIEMARTFLFLHAVSICLLFLPVFAYAECLNETSYTTGNESIDNLQKLFKDTLKVNEKQFDGKTGKVIGFGAGAGYPQIWLRDSATIIPASRYFYDTPYLTTWLVEHLSHQREDGNLFDWIAFGNYNMLKLIAPHARRLVKGAAQTLVADKNSVVADQETSAVHSAYQIHKITGDIQFLRQLIDGKSLINRLEDSLYYLLLYRYDEKTGLITKGFTADWGDVSVIYDSQLAIYMDDKTPRVVNTYVNAYFVMAARELSEMFSSLENTGNAVFWGKQSEKLKKNINTFLWDEKRGYYLMHRRVDTYEKTFDEDSMFAMGSNALAIEAGVADRKKTKRIFETAVKLQKQYNISTIASVLLPPYPDGFFIHAVLTKSYTYQNGGQWDWFAGRLVLQEFLYGYSKNAAMHLLEIAKKNYDNSGLYEWDTPEGKGMGSAQLAGSAGALSGALFEGYFGVDLSHDTLNITPRVQGKLSAVNIYEPSTNQCIRYEMEKGEKQILFKYEAALTNEGNICLPVPRKAKKFYVFLDDIPFKNFRLSRKGSDSILCLKTSFTPHEILVRW